MDAMNDVTPLNSKNVEQSPFMKISLNLTFKMSECGVDLCSCSDDEFGSDTEHSPSIKKLHEIDEDEEVEEERSHNDTCKENKLKNDKM